MKLKISVLTFALAGALGPPAQAGPASCESLASLVLPDTTITVAAVVPAGAFDPPGPTPPIDTAACRECFLILSLSPGQSFFVSPRQGRSK